MGKVVKAIAIVAAIAVVVFAPQISAAILTALAVKSAIAAALLTAALTVGAGLALRALSVRPPSARGSGTPSVFRQTVSDSFIVYGLRRVGGLLVFFHSRKVGKRHYRYFVIAVAGHRCKGLVRWFLNDEEVSVDGAGKVTSGAYANHAWLWFQRGLASETANATFVAECGGKWTADHRGDGIAAIYAKFEMTDAVVEAGMPNVTAEIEGRDEIHDPRDDTDKYTANAILVTYDWLAMAREDGGFGAYADEIPGDDWISAQANVCDEDLAGGPRYAIDAVIVTGAPPSELRDALVTAMAGSYTYSGGKHLVRPGYWVPVSEVLAENDLAGPVQVSPFLSGDIAANEVQGTFIDPGALYQPAPFNTQTVSPAPSDVRQLDLDLPFTTRLASADYIASVMLKRAQCEKKVVWPMNIEGLKVATLDTVQLATDRYGLANYAFVVTGWSLSAEYDVVLSLREENPEIYDPPPPASPPAPPALDPAEIVETEKEAQQLIATSWTVPTQVLYATEDAVGMIEHDRHYADGRVVHIAADEVGGLVSDTGYYAHYVDIGREDTAPALIVSTASDSSVGVVGAHNFDRIKTAVAGSGDSYTGGSSVPPGRTPTGGEVQTP